MRPRRGAILYGCTNESPRRVGPGDRVPPATEGPEARRPARPRRASACGVLSVLARRRPRRQGVGLGAADAGRTVPREGPRDPLRTAALDPRGDHGAPVEEEGPRDLQLGPDQLVGLR